jgi:hypothetical protein
MAVCNACLTRDPGGAFLGRRQFSSREKNLFEIAQAVFRALLICELT